jgi:HAD superfamily hydrolase (TIGR01509 family)
MSEGSRLARQVQAVLFDAGNTLAGWDLDFVVGLLGEIGVNTSTERLTRAEAAARPDLSATIAGGRSTESGEIKSRYLELVLDRLDAGWALPELAARLRDVSSAQLWARLLPGVAPSLARLSSAGIKLGVVSNADGTIADQLDAHGVGEYFDVVIDSGTVGVEKPDPAIFHLALDALGVHPSAAAHVGDLYAVDIVGARAAGIRALLLDPFGDWPDMDCETHRDLPSVTARLLRGVAPAR